MAVSHIFSLPVTSVSAAAFGHFFIIQEKIRKKSRWRGGVNLGQAGCGR